MYAQRWPVTSCAQWEEAKPDNTCDLPQNKNTWTVHGIWPTKYGTEGPLFCPSAARWTNVEANTKPYSFWKHEWDKHGTCSVTLPALNSVTNFFTKGLTLNKQFELSEILAQSKITPCKSGYTPQQIYDAVKSVTKADPMIQCVVDRHTKESMISEIRICLNKTFEVIDCDHANPNNKLGGDVVGNCDLKKPVMYLDQVPGRHSWYEMDYFGDALSHNYEERMHYFELSEILARSNITPCKSGYTPQQIYDAVKLMTEADPMIQCVVDRHTKESMISEIRICLNKTFEVIDCDHANPDNKLRGDVVGNCDLKKPVMYLDQVPGRHSWYEMDYFGDALHNYEERMHYIYDAVKSVTRVDPMIQCVVDRHTKESMISEIRICLNKTFEVIDCDHANPDNKLRGDVVGNCDLKKPVMYLDRLVGIVGTK
ncbi:unnamed protein product [Phaedon cochleariae]|uniref:Uncharacterized protein n=1 Tax=Phaedon cochleariae TaxID=80249 RepID=A0A9N9X464_PHACE|nr:unnamed protein product [Phaedon cochleariae]